MRVKNADSMTKTLVVAHNVNSLSRIGNDTYAMFLIAKSCHSFLKLSHLIRFWRFEKHWLVKTPQGPYYFNTDFDHGNKFKSLSARFILVSLLYMCVLIIASLFKSYPLCNFLKRNLKVIAKDEQIFFFHFHQLLAFHLIS